MTQKTTKYSAPALEKGLDIIELLSISGSGMSQGDIAKALDRSQSEIYRMLSTLVQRGYVIRSVEDDLYSLSLKLFAVSQRLPPVERLLEIAIPRMRVITKRAWQSCHMGMESNGSIVIVASVSSPWSWGLSLRAGSVVGLGNTGTGRVLAAFRTDEQIDELLDDHQLAPGEPEIDRAEFMDHVARIREVGYERMPSSTVLGVTNLVFPVFDKDCRAISVVNCPYMERIDNLQAPSVDEVMDIYKTFADELTAYYNGQTLNWTES
ncbi:IclR family transcriptional regulator [Thalassovita mediterranea]|uniref:Pectin degradation repressor protein KdgR n=1 Tax=Thalassovita mediterranea TaxID=340021 RepID=A0A0P1GP31_9RHOB|nr:IclR family transcriptional regulator [Thalassovita mediterranea]CUH84145.1 Pectin degradation repressor protein KdgR [Thalassovita mediterranea]SIS27653.1 transcriptional regulator, IclR family [Thalassovita mediterranea]